MRKFIFLLILFLAAAAIVPASVTAAPREEGIAKLEAATAILREVMAIPDNAIPANLLENAYGVAVFPGVIKAAFWFGGRYGEGVMTVKTEEKAWGNPFFVRLAGASFGLQFGAQSSDLILVFNSRRSIDRFREGQFILGADAAVAAGPVGRTAEADTDLLLSADILSYSRTRGLFAGVAVHGAALSLDTDANHAFYGPKVDVFTQRGLAANEAANRFNCVLASYTFAPGKVCA